MKDNFSKTIFESENLGIVYSTMKADETIRTEEYNGVLLEHNCVGNVNKVIIYHHNDLDGYTAGAVAMLSMKCPYNAFVHDHDVNIITKSVNHVKSIEWDPDEFDENTEVWFVDYPLTDDKNFEFFKALTEKIPAGHLVYIDHHYASEDLYSKNKELFSHIPGIVGDYKLSGAALTWLYIAEFGSNKTHMNTIPEFVKYVSDWDTFAHAEGSDTVKFKYGADTFPELRSLKGEDATIFWLNTIIWESDKNPYSMVKECIYRGEYIYGYAESQGSKARYMTGAEYTFVFNDKEYSVYVINGLGNSLIFGEEYHKHDFVCLWYYNNDINLYNYSFYSKYDSRLNVSDMCKLFGGGGHKGAAGFRTKRLIFDLAENKTLNLNMCADILGR